MRHYPIICYIINPSQYLSSDMFIDTEVCWKFSGILQKKHHKNLYPYYI